MMDRDGARRRASVRVDGRGAKRLRLSSCERDTCGPVALGAGGRPQGSNDPGGCAACAKPAQKAGGFSMRLVISEHKACHCRLEQGV